jgi:hypothetical protein
MEHALHLEFLFGYYNTKKYLLDRMNLIGKPIRWRV